MRILGQTGTTLFEEFHFKFSLKMKTISLKLSSRGEFEIFQGRTLNVTESVIRKANVYGRLRRDLSTDVDTL